jgi:mono/diheme cytochrome c family protein
MRKSILFALLVLVAAVRLAGQNPAWPVPDDQKGKIAPVKFNPEMVKTGEGVYLKNCQSCHGLPSKKNFAAIQPSPGDLSENKVGGQTDGELFYRITAGKAPMPEFRNILSEDERWSVISYLRTFHKGYVQPDPEKALAGSGKRIKLSMAYDTAKNKMVVKAIEYAKEGPVPAKGINVVVFVTRYFGTMSIADPKATSEAGIASFEWPKDLPGDKDGNVIVGAKVSDPSGNLPESAITDTLGIGTPTNKPSLTDTRAMWSTRDKAPVWIILTYSLAVITVWAFIFYILISVIGMRKIKEA